MQRNWALSRKLKLLANGLIFIEIAMENITLYPHGRNNPVWEKIENDLAKEDVLDYEMIIPEGEKQVVLTIDVDLGGGFEGGFATTSFSAMLPHDTRFRFAIHKEDFIDEIGKFFGMQDVKVGSEMFDKKIIVKTNDEVKVKRLFSDTGVQQTFVELENFSFGIHSHHVSGAKEPFLELVVDDAITDLSNLRNLYSAFYDVLTQVEGLAEEGRDEGATSTARL